MMPSLLISVVFFVLTVGLAILDIQLASEDEYNFISFGYNLRPLELHAAVAREQLKKLEQFRRQRQQNWHNFFTWTMDLPITQPKVNGS